MVEKSQWTIRLDQFIKFVGLAPTGGQAKLIIQSGQVLVNGQGETHRSRKLVAGDQVTFQGQTIVVKPN